MYCCGGIKRVLTIFLMAITVYLGAVLLWQGSGADAQKKTLYWGSRGSDVVLVQQKLKQWGYYSGFNDGVYGSTTFGAVRDFQRKNGLRADGVVGPGTWAALGFNVGADVGSAGSSGSGTKSSATVSRGFINESRDITLLARVIEGEAANEALYGKVAVGAVVLNRVKSSAFPGTIAGVIYQPHAFESVTNGQYTRPLTPESINAARLAMTGQDPTGGAVFFWNPAKPVSPWIWSRQVISRIGSHVFAR